jgi:GAF domain-containing protein
VAIAIQNARSFEITQELLTEAEKTSGAYMRESWKVLQSQAPRIGYVVSAGGANPLDRRLSTPQIKQALSRKEAVTENGKNPVLVVPIRLREQVIGVMDIRMPHEHDWDVDERDIAEAVAERLSLAIETSILLESTQKRAEIERVTSEISGRISATTQFDAILRTAAEELSRVLGGSDVLVQIQPEALENS